LLIQQRDEVREVVSEFKISLRFSIISDI